MANKTPINDRDFRRYYKRIISNQKTEVKDLKNRIKYLENYIKHLEKHGKDGIIKSKKSPQDETVEEFRERLRRKFCKGVEK